MLCQVEGSWGHSSMVGGRVLVTDFFGFSLRPSILITAPIRKKVRWAAKTYVVNVFSWLLGLLLVIGV